MSRGAPYIHLVYDREAWRKAYISSYNDKRLKVIRMLHIHACCALSLLSTTAAKAEPTFPTKPVLVIVPFAPGGGADTLARILFSKLREGTGVKFIFLNGQQKINSTPVPIISRHACSSSQT